MEKISDSIFKTLPHLRLYRDEIEELYQFLIGIADEKVIIETCGYRLSSIDEISQLSKDTTHDIQFSTNKPYIRIRLTAYSGDIYIGKGDVEAEGIASLIENILLKGKTYQPLLHNNPWLSFLPVIPLIVGIIMRNIFIIILGSVLFIASVVWLSVETHFSVTRYNIIIFHSRKNTLNFWKRNKDQIIMLIVGAVIGIAATVLGSIVIESLK
ncbi:MAG: hypothetical protein WAV05_17325 [Anaerolineales bacterium]